jgi:hypothetical protein
MGPFDDPHLNAFIRRLSVLGQFCWSQLHFRHKVIVGFNPKCWDLRRIALDDPVQIRHRLLTAF